MTRVALVGTSMGGIVAIASVAVLGDGTLAGADVDTGRTATCRAGAATADRRASSAIRSRPSSRSRSRPACPGPAVASWPRGCSMARRGTLGADPRATEPARVIGLVEPVPLLLIHGEADTTVPIADGRRLAELAGPSAQHWVVEGAGHSGGHAVGDRRTMSGRTTDFLRMAIDGRTQSTMPTAPTTTGPVL